MEKEGGYALGKQAENVVLHRREIGVWRVTLGFSYRTGSCRNSRFQDIGAVRGAWSGLGLRRLESIPISAKNGVSESWCSENASAMPGVRRNCLAHLHFFVIFLTRFQRTFQYELINLIKSTTERKLV
jgi:hypothetical protein